MVIGSITSELCISKIAPFGIYWYRTLERTSLEVQLTWLHTIAMAKVVSRQCGSLSMVNRQALGCILGPEHDWEHD